MLAALMSAYKENLPETPQPTMICLFYRVQQILHVHSGAWVEYLNLGWSQEAKVSGMLPHGDSG
jgi:hypothetical protein